MFQGGELTKHVLTSHEFSQIVGSYGLFPPAQSRLNYLTPPGNQTCLVSLSKLIPLGVAHLTDKQQGRQPVLILVLLPDSPASSPVSSQSCF